jgi:hypothetical protein
MYEDGAKSKGLGLNTDDLQLFSLSTGTGNQNRIDAAAIKKGNWGKIHLDKVPSRPYNGNQYAKHHVLH